MCCTDAFAGVERHVSELAARPSRGRPPRDRHRGGDQARVRAMRPGDGVRRAARAPHRRRHAQPAAPAGPPDIVNVHMTAAEVAVALAAVAARRARRQHAALRLARGRPRLRPRPLARWARRRVDAQIAVSQYVADHVDGPSTVVLSGVQPEPGRVPACRPTPPCRARRPAARAGEATPTSRSAPSPTSGLASRAGACTVAGDGALRGELEALASALGIGGHGRLPRPPLRRATT